MKLLLDLNHLPDPSGPMNIKVSRRGLLTAAADAAEERTRTRSGAPSYRIEDLIAYDDTQLREIIPTVNRRTKISLRQGVVYAETSASTDPIPLFLLDSPVLFIFNQFNGQQKMRDIFVNVQEFTDWDETKTIIIVRSVFLSLCEVRVCEPG